MTLATATRDGVPSVAGGVAEGRRRPRLCVLHQLRQPQGRGAGRQPARRAVLSLEVAGPADPHRGHRRAGLARRRRTPISRRGRATARSAPGRRTSRARSTAAPSSKQRFAEFARQYADRRGAAAAQLVRLPGAAGRVEFWQERPFRLHDRLVFVREGEAWRKAAPLSVEAGPRRRSGCGVRATYASLAVAAVLIAAKFVAWIGTGSVALLSSLVDSLVDAAASLVTFFAVRHAARAARPRAPLRPRQGRAAGRARPIGLSRRQRDVADGRGGAPADLAGAGRESGGRHRGHGVLDRRDDRRSSPISGMSCATPDRWRSAPTSCTTAATFC